MTTAAAALGSRKGRCLAVVLAAGNGTRMRSSLPKVLHPVAGRSLLAHAIASVTAAGADAIAVVVSPGREAIAAEARRILPEADIFVQAEQRGTAHAVLAAREAIARGYDEILVAFGDTPLVEGETYGRMRAGLAAASVVALGFEAADPTGYGRFIIRDGRLVAIREHKDATDEERTIRLCNGGIMALRGADALAILEAIGCSNAANEFYLTDAVEIANRQGLVCAADVAPESELMGVNDRVQLALAERLFQEKARTAAMRSGVTMVAPETVFLSYDTVLGPDVVIEPNVVFGPGVTVEGPAVIHAFSHLEGAHVAAGASVGPFARLRPGARLAAKAKVGNFVEIKNADIGQGAKVSHLTYVGDATVGAEANLGAGTITCNYDGFSKFRTVIGDNAFVGSNSSLVAPVTIGAGAFVGSGSVVTDDVPPDALAIGRGRQTVKDGWAKTFRENNVNKKHGR
ncbi:bifunctional UDP-N-acetylglucosamine diphosphorylase/glucosamine-1-phosphate N-acetyltransferase GlmU [uncultured Alsobacter sp.]|uniref:bifunctional UDP-N-acetylglucosamine diphosphorylase/glucosamine-1-phosphate N-acetyltransferase GlmU n=1 Tax=uncultured Alsobacter sp. TaxID=1748258 RepID=UPI0025F37250|nr:bifunctional UDP-N-acetylglucosamine diphosphorylase/glucosamine-1-phosphate N-acetyltransferase GlmU [uncultured Alsobacter sp.]